jgi:glycosyltransferase involved in cell wall biosynthesis
LKEKICFLIANIDGFGGTERVTSVIANGLVKRGYLIDIISCKDRENRKYILDNEINVIYLKENKCQNSMIRKLKTLMDIQKTILNREYNIIVAVDMYLYLYLYPYVKKNNCKYIAWEHFNYYINEIKGERFARKLAVKSADKVVVLGKNDMKNYSEHFPKATNITYIYNPVSFVVSSHNNLKKKHEVIAVGRLEKQKGFDRLIESWAKVESTLTEESDWHLNIYGEGTQRKKLEGMIASKNLHRVNLKGFCNDIEEKMSTASIFTLSSRYEGFVLVLIEALANGMACVSYDCKEGPAELIIDDFNGFLVQNGNIDCFSDRLIRLINDDTLRNQFSKNSNVNLDRFEINTVLDRWEELFKELSS